MTCQCEQPGYCPKHQRQMSAVRFDECKNKPGYFQVFQEALHNRKPELWQTCEHRGPIDRQEKADLCGRKGETFDVFECAIHGDCALGRFCKKQTIRSCVGCEDAKSPTDGQNATATIEAKGV